jgi:CheY-like chemotaxis protein
VVCGEVGDGTDTDSKAKELFPDLIILDVRMPGLNGMEVAGILRYALPKVRITLLTMYAEDLGKYFPSLFRTDAVLAKANGLADLTGIVTRLLADGEPDSAASETLQAT